MNIICKNCGSEVSLPDGVTSGFCGNCGAKVEATAPEAENVVEKTETVVEETETVAPETPAVEETPVVTPEAPAVEETPAVTPETPAVEETPAVTPETPAVEETPAVTPETPAVEETPVVTPEAENITPETESPFESFEAESEPVTPEKTPASVLDGAIASLPPSLQNKRLLALIAAVILVFIIGVVTIIAVVVMSGNGSYKSAESKTFDALTSAGNFAGTGGGSSTEFDVTYTPSDELLESLSSLGILSNGSDYLSVNGIVSVFGNSMLVDILGYTDDIDAYVVGTYNGNEMTVAFPDATDYVLSYSVAKPEDEKVFTLNKNALNKTLNAIEKEYFRIAENSYEVVKNDELKGGDITVKADKYTFKFTREDSLNFALFAIDEIRKNDNLVDYITKTYQQADEDFDFDEILDDLESEIDDELYDLSETEKKASFLRMRAWVYRGNIVSREIDNFYTSPNLKLSYIALANSKAAYAKASAGDNYSSVKVTADFAREGKFWGGDVRLTVNDDDASVKATVKNMTLSGKYLTGEVGVKGTLSSAEIDFDLEFDKLDNRQRAVISGKVGGNDLGELQISYNNKSIGSLKLPTYEEDNIVDLAATSDDEEMRERYQQFTTEIREYFLGF
ncbi:MAG: hypothetical protein LBM59_06340 [Ruminococcus sp.]|jgi:hypothetical protein|nr:hypothetical protein [Ruminococcus sp.]